MTQPDDPTANIYESLSITSVKVLDSDKAS